MTIKSLESQKEEGKSPVLKITGQSDGCGGFGKIITL